MFSCSGYRLVKKSNPFREYSIKKLSIPMFLNKTSINNVAPSITKELILKLNKFNSLQIVGTNSNPDAYLIGVIRSSKQMMKTLVVTGERVAGDAAPSNTAGRRDFSIPTSNDIRMKLHLYLIVKPTREDIEYAYLNPGKIKGIFNSRVVFNTVLSLNASYNREVFDGEANVVSGTQSRSARNLAIDTMAKNAADSFERIVINAF